LQRIRSALLADRIGSVHPVQLEAFGLDPDVLHLNHGAFGVAPVVVRRAAAAWRERAERLVVIDRITSPTATVVPVAAVAAAVAGVGTSVLVDAAHAPGQLRDDIPALGADHWIGNLHKWAYAPRGSAMLWSGWDAVARLADLAAEGQKRVAAALGVTLERLPAVPAPAMRLVPMPGAVLTSPEQVDPFYEALSQRRVEVAPVHFDGVGYLRIAAAPYNTPEDYDRLADTVRELLQDTASRPALRPRALSCELADRPPDLQALLDGCKQKEFQP
jgi:hypothetical protein